MIGVISMKQKGKKMTLRFFCLKKEKNNFAPPT
jgi:hypothetical protein